MLYLADLNRTQDQINQTTAQVTSGIRVTQASDDPAELAAIMQLQANIAQNTQVQTNLTSASSELQTSDTVLQNAISILEKAETLASQGATSTETSDERAALATEVAGLQAQLIHLSQTQVNGKYIFSGDQDTQPSYEANSSGVNGVTQLLTATNTRTITDAAGTTISVGLTAQEIFDPQNADGSSATGNTFAAINNLLVALQNNDQTGIANATTDLKNADTYVNLKLTFYGTAESRVSDATTMAQKYQTQTKQDLSNLRDTDVASAAVSLSQEKVQLEAATSAEASILQMKNIFDYIG